VLDGHYFPRYDGGGLNVNRLAHMGFDPNAPNEHLGIKGAYMTALIMRGY